MATHIAREATYIGFGAMDVTKPYESVRFGAMDVIKPYESIWFLKGFIVQAGRIVLAAGFWGKEKSMAPNAIIRLRESP